MTTAAIEEARHSVSDDKSLRDRVCIVGIGETTYSKNSGVSDLVLQLTGFKLACDDAGIDPKEIDGIVAMTYGAVSEDYMTNFGLRTSSSRPARRWVGPRRPPASSWPR